MRRSSILVGIIGGLVFANVGAHVPAQDRQPRPRQQQTANLVTITGSLMASPDATTYFVTATPPELASQMEFRTEGVVPTHSYQLAGREKADLQRYVGHTVDVRGESDPDVEAQIEIRRLTLASIRSVAPTCVEKREK